MYPTIELLWLKIWTFGTLISMSWLLFITLLHHFSWKEGFTKSIFSDRTLIIFTLAIFFFGRIGYIFSEWRNEQFILKDLMNGNIIEFLRLFFTPENYHFSLFGWVFGFFMVFFVRTSSMQKDRLRYLDAIVWAFLYSALLGYFATFLWGQIYGIPFHSFISIIYTHKESIVWLRSALFPLPIFYIFWVTLILVFLKTFQRRIQEIPHGFLGFIALWLYSGLLFLGEFLNGSEDMFHSYFALDLNQIGACIGIIISFIWIFRNIEKKI